MEERVNVVLNGGPEPLQGGKNTHSWTRYFVSIFLLNKEEGENWNRDTIEREPSTKILFFSKNKRI